MPLKNVFNLELSICLILQIGATFRSKFNEIWQKMINKMEMGKKYILDLIEQSVSAYEQREELCNKLQNLEGKSQNEQNLHLQVNFIAIIRHMR